MSTSASEDTDLRPTDVTGWVGWIVFGAVMMVISGGFDIIWGIAGIARDEVFVTGPRDNVVDLDYTTWGWMKLILGIVMVIVGISLFVGAMFAQVLAVVVAALSAIANLLVIAAFPIWSAIVIAVDLVVIYAICVHGREMRPYVRG